MDLYWPNEKDLPFCLWHCREDTTVQPFPKQHVFARNSLLDCVQVSEALAEMLNSERN